MKGVLACLLTVACVLLLASCGESGALQADTLSDSAVESLIPQIAGGVESTDEAVTEELRGIFDAAMADYTDATYEPLKLIGRQVVAGMNYTFLCRVIPHDGSAESRQQVQIYVDLAGNSQVLNITDAAE